MEVALSHQFLKFTPLMLQTPMKKIIAPFIAKCYTKDVDPNVLGYKIKRIQSENKSAPVLSEDEAHAYYVSIEFL